jgi:hypothetical protein
MLYTDVSMLMSQNLAKPKQFKGRFRINQDRQIPLAQCFLSNRILMRMQIKRGEPNGSPLFVELLAA